MALRVHAPVGNPRASKILVAATIANLQVELVNTPYDQLKKKEFLAKNPNGKVPVLETADGFVFESQAILRHIARLAPDAGLYGENLHQQSLVDQWLDYSALEVESLVYALIIPILGHYPFEEFVQKKAHTDLTERLKVIENALKDKEWLVGSKVTIADIALASTLNSLYSLYLDEKNRKGYPNTMKWFTNVTNIQAWKTEFGRPRLCQKTFPVPKTEEKEDKPKEKKEEKPKEKKEEKPKEKKEEKKKEEKPKEKKEEKKQEKKPKKEEEEDETAEKKKENPLDLLPPSQFNLDDYKRKFFNDKNIPETLNWLYQNFDSKGWSLWIVKYEKAENEGKLLLKTNNTMKGFLQRIDPHFKKFSFAIWGVYGDENNYEIRGAWLWRGVEIPNEFKDHPSYEFHKFTQLDVTKEEDRNLFSEYWINQTEDESKVEGLTARSLQYWR